MKTVFIISGFNLHLSATSNDYQDLRDQLADKGYRVVPVPISWMHTTPRQYTAKFIEFYQEHKGSYNLVIGNSFGAVVALLSAPEIKPDELFLCSLSPFFKDDIHAKPDAYFERYFGKKRMAELRSTDFDLLTEQINSLDIRTTITYGQDEHRTSPSLVNRCVDASNKINKSRLIELPNAPHSMEDPKYTEELLKILW